MSYMQFLVVLALGLFGVCMVLMILMDVLLADWDVSSEFKSLMRRPATFIRNYGLEGNGQEAPLLSTRLSRSPDKNGLGREKASSEDGAVLTAVLSE